jgi:hydrogenase maturation protease
VGVPLVVGVGHPDRGDDTVGLLVADAVHSADPAVDVAALADPLALLDVMAGRDLVVVVDAAVTGTAVGTVQVFDASAAPLPAVAAGVPSSSHGVSLSDAIELARTLGVLPTRLAVITIEAGEFDLGRGAQPAVLAAAGQATATVLGLVRGAAGGRERRGRPRQ